MKNRLKKFLSKRQSKIQRKEYVRNHDIFTAHHRAYIRQFNMLAGRAIWY